MLKLHIPECRRSVSLLICGWCLLFPLVALAAALSSAAPCHSQELDPRRWSHLPTGLNFAGIGYAYSESDISDSPALRLEDVESEVHTWLLKYIRTFNLLEKSVRVDLTQGYQKGHWSGMLDGAAAETDREGWTDSIARLSINLYGPPPLTGKAYADYRAKTDVTTIVGAAVAVHFPTGEYMSEKLINLGTNRFTIRPQFGVVHERGNWTMEAGASAWIFTDNDNFFGGSKLENEPLYVLQSHLIYTWDMGFWIGAGAGYAFGKRSTIDGVEKDDRKEIKGWSLSAGYPITRDWGVKVGYVGRRRMSNTGSDNDTFAIGIVHFW